MQKNQNIDFSSIFIAKNFLNFFFHVLKFLSLTKFALKTKNCFKNYIHLIF